MNDLSRTTNLKPDRADGENLAGAAYAAQQAGHYLAMAFATRTYAPDMSLTWRTYALEQMRNLTNAMGFDLVERLSPQEAHEALLAARRAEGDEGDHVMATATDRRR